MCMHIELHLDHEPLRLRHARLLLLDFAVAVHLALLPVWRSQGSLRSRARAPPSSMTAVGIVRLLCLLPVDPHLLSERRGQ